MFNLSDETFNKLTKIQKVLLVVLTISSILLSVIFFVAAKGYDGFEMKVNIYNTALNNLVFAAALICGYIYASRGYTKDVSKFYKAFLCLYAFTTIIQVVTSYRLTGSVFVAASCVIRFVLVLVLGFVKDLGKKNTWIVFYILLAFELLVAPFSVPNLGAVAAENNGAVSGYLAYNAIVRLVTTGILGLCIEAKYRDKEARGTK